MVFGFIHTPVDNFVSKYPPRFCFPAELNCSAILSSQERWENFHKNQWLAIAFPVRRLLWTS
jgi:hypothetical protein